MNLALLAGCAPPAPTLGALADAGNPGCSEGIQPTAGATGLIEDPMADPNPRRMGPRKGLPPGRHHQVWLTDSEAELAALAAAVRLYRETGEIRKGSLSREVGIRVAPGLVADATAWVTDESLPLSLRERAQVLTRPPPQE